MADHSTLLPWGGIRSTPAKYMDADDNKYRPKSSRLQKQLLAFMIFSLFCFTTIMFYQSFESDKQPSRPEGLVFDPSDALSELGKSIDNNLPEILRAPLLSAPSFHFQHTPQPVADVDQMQRAESSDYELNSLRKQLEAATKLITELREELNAKQNEPVIRTRPLFPKANNNNNNNNNNNHNNENNNYHTPQHDKHNFDTASHQISTDPSPSPEPSPPPRPKSNIRNKESFKSAIVTKRVVNAQNVEGQQQQQQHRRRVNGELVDDEDEQNWKNSLEDVPGDRSGITSEMHGPVAPMEYDVAAHSREPIDEVTSARRQAVKQAMDHAWGNYKKYAFGKDELKPLSHTTHNDFSMGLTLIDSLDTLWLMEMKDDFDQAAEWVENSLDFGAVNITLSVFETFIRVVGGLLSAYELSARPLFLDKAVDIVDRLRIAFKSPTGIPYSVANLKTKSVANHGWAGKASIIAEAGSVQIEMRALSRFTGDDQYAKIGDKAFLAVDNTPGKPFTGLYPLLITNTVPPKFTTAHISIGAMGDSFYEYMLKLYLQTHKTQERFRRMYEASAQGIMQHLVGHTSDGLPYIHEVKMGAPIQVMEHLTCFAGAMFALGAHSIEDLQDRETHLSFAKDIARTCYEGYRRMKTGVAPDTWRFDDGTIQAEQRAFYILRPETVETFFVLFRVTGDPMYREWGWEIFQNIEKHTRVEGGYSGIEDVNVLPPRHNDKMESFFLAETLKYLYLLFSPTDLVSLEEFVFNTEAHPLRKFTP